MNIKSFEAKEMKKRPLVIKIADFLTAVFGSIPFLTFNLLVFIIWILGNVGGIPDFPVFDPFPFTFLTMAVSLEAIFLAIIVLMSQNRQSYISTLREELDMQVNLVAEREITKILKLVKAIVDAKGIKVEDIELEEMLKDTDVSYIERQLEKQLNGNVNLHTEIAKDIIRPIEKARDEFNKKMMLL
ncbi:MAG TPA: DUF1003 domain-containing protein [Alphaproteobacteria bacterium]|jgi:uncharacterized membrane protein|nr:DUF1003 domain-containing protein [Alphaproteobacteria bacterium]